MGTEADGPVDRDVVSGAREWLRKRVSERDEYRAQLLEERETARKRITEIDGVLEEMGAQFAPDPHTNGHRDQAMAHKTERRTVNAPPLDPKKASLPQLVAHVVLATPGMDVRSVIRGVQAIKPTVATPNVYPAVYRMRDDGRLRVENDKYYPPNAEAETE